MNQPKSTLFQQPEYRANRQHGLCRRIATFLDHQAEHEPRTMVPYPEIAQRVLGLKSKPGRHSKLTLAVRDELYRARDLMVSLFGRDLITNGAGARATIDADEMFRFRLGVDLLRAAQRVGRYGHTARLIREKGVTDPRIVEHLHRAEAFTLAVAVPLRQLLGSYTALIDDSIGNPHSHDALAGESADDGARGGIAEASPDLAA